MRLFIGVLMTVLISAAPLQHTTVIAHGIERHAVDTVTDNERASPFVGVDSFETRLMVTGILVFVLVVFALLLSIKIKRLDQLKGMD